MPSNMKMNIVGKQKLTPEIVLYVLDKIFIVNLHFMNFKVKVKVTRSST